MKDDGGKQISFDALNNDPFIERLRSGDADAFRVLFTLLLPKLCVFLSREFKFSESDAEEVAADAMTKVHSAITSFNRHGGAKITTWVFQVTKNTAIDFVRQQLNQSQKQRNVQLDDAAAQRVGYIIAEEWLREQSARGDTCPGNRTAPPDAHQSQYKLQLRRALDALPEHDRNLLLMRQNMEYEEIAAVENASVATLRTRHSRAMSKLREEITKDQIT